MLAEATFSATVGIAALFVVAGAIAACFGKLMPAVLCLAVGVMFALFRG